MIINIFYILNYYIVFYFNFLYIILFLNMFYNSIMAYLATGMFLVPFCIEPICKVSSSAQGIYSLMSNISSYTCFPDIVFALRKLDIEASVRVLEILIKELDIKHKTDTLEQSLNLLKECLTNIENELCDIHQKLAYNRSLWIFSSLRTYKFTNSIGNLEILKNQLDNRKKIFFDILNNNNNFVMCKKNNTLDISIID